MANTFIKDPDAVLDYLFDLAPLTNGREGATSDWLASGETIGAHTIDADTGITVVSSSVTDGGTSVTVWLSGGKAGTRYKVRCEFVTTAGRTDERTMLINVKER